MRPEERLRRAPAPDAPAARERARRVVLAAPLPVRRRRRWLPVAFVVAALTIAVAPTGDAIASWLSGLLRIDPIAAPPPEPRLAELPAPGRVLITGPSGAWSIASDGSRTRLGDYGDVAWSPRGLFIVAAAEDQLRAIERDGAVRWSIRAPAPVADPAWAPSGYRIAYRAGGQQRVVAGDGTGDAALVDGVADAPAAWRPGQEHELVLARDDGAVELWSVDDGRRLWRILPGSPVVRLLWQHDDALVIVRRDAIEVVDLSRRLRRTSQPVEGPVTAGALLGDRIAFATGRTVSTGDLLPASATLRAKVRLRAAGRVTDLVPAPTGRQLIVASAAADQWVFLPARGSKRVSAATVRGFSGVEGWETEPLASASTGDGRQLVLSSFTGGGGCLVISGLDAFDRQCLYAPSRRRPQAKAPLLTGPVAQKSASSPVEVYGEVSAEADRIELSYSLDGSPGAQEAVLLRAHDPAVLRRAGVTEPFGAFVAELPSRARNPIATAYDAAGRELGRDGFAAIDPHVFIGTAGPGDLPDYDAIPWAYADAEVSPKVGDGGTQDFRVVFTTSHRTGVVDGERRSYVVRASTGTPAAGCVNARDNQFAAAPAGTEVSARLRLADGEGGNTRWCAGRYRGEVEFAAPGVRGVVARFAFRVTP